MSEQNEASVQSVAHTPGPWAACNTTVYAVDDGEPIARCLDKEIHRAFSDAKLIAAAPEMFEFVRRFATIDWMGEAELNMWAKKCQEIMRRVM